MILLILGCWGQKWISYLSDFRSATTRKPMFPEVESGVLELRANPVAVAVRVAGPDHLS